MWWGIRHSLANIFIQSKSALFMPVICTARYENNVKFDLGNQVCKAVLMVFWTHDYPPNHLEAYDSYVSSSLINGIISYPVCAFYILSLNADIAIYAALSIRRWTLEGKAKIKLWLQEGAITPLRVKVIFIYLVFIKLPLTDWNSSHADLMHTLMLPSILYILMLLCEHLIYHWWHCKTWKSHTILYFVMLSILLVILFSDLK